MDNLQKAQKRYEKAAKRNKEFHIEFTRSQNADGKFVTKANIVRREREYHYKGAGLIHNIDYAMKYRVEGDIPSINKKLNSWQPNTAYGKIGKLSLKTTNFAVRDVARTAMDVGLFVETAADKSFKAAESTAGLMARRYAAKFQQQSSDDVTKAAVHSGRLVITATKGTISHIKQKKQFRLENAKAKLMKEELKAFETKVYKPKLAQNKKEIAIEKDTERLQTLKFENKQLRSQRKFLKKESRGQHKIAKLTKPDILLIKPVKFAAREMAASAWQRAAVADERNDFMSAIDKSVTASKSIKAAKKPKLQKAQQKRDKLQKSKQGTEKRLQKKESKLKNSRKAAKANSARRRRHTVSGGGRSKKKRRAARQAASAASKILGGFGGMILFVLLIILVLFILVNSVLQAIFGNSGWIMGTYTAQDKYLSQAEEYYTKLAFDFNETLFKVGSADDWKSGISDFGKDTSEMDDDPQQWFWGRSVYFDYDPVYDFDRFKLWSFLCAYFYDFSSNNDDSGLKDESEDEGKTSNIGYWEYGDEVEEVIDALFKDEYRFVCKYDNTSRWEKKQTYDYYGGNFGDSFSYYKAQAPSKISGNKNYTYKFKLDTRPNEIAEYLDSDGFLYLKRVDGEYRIVNPNKRWHNTGYLLQDQRFYMGDSVPAYTHRGGSTDDPDNFFLSINGNEYSRDRRFWGDDEAWFMITPGNAQQLFPDSSDITNDTWMYNVVKKYYWETDCRLYYNVNQLKSFDKVIKDTLEAMENGKERYGLYEMFLGTAEDSKTTRGNHITFADPLKKDLQELIDNGKIFNWYGYDMQMWKTRHCEVANEGDGHYGIDILCDMHSVIYAGMDGEIDKIDAENNLIVIRKDGYKYWYDGDGNGKNRDTKLYYYNVSAKSTLSEGDKVKKGSVIGFSLPERKCESADNSSYSDEFYIHIKVEIDTNGPGWHYIDPVLVFE